MVFKCERLLGLAVKQPEVFVFHRPRAISFLGVVNDAHTRAVVYVYWSGGLLVSEFFQGESHDFCLLGVQE